MKEELPSIDNHCNQLEVSDYVDEIYEYYWVYEVIIMMLLSDTIICILLRFG